jgi:fumarate reductase flavoprotein subunit
MDKTKRDTKAGIEQGQAQDTASPRLAMDRRRFVQTLAAAGAVAVTGGALAGCAAREGNSSKPGGGGDGGTTAPAAYDIIVVGAGGSGLATAVSVKENGVASVTIFEKEIANGGNTNFSSSGMNASETRFQRAQGIEDTNALFVEDTFKGGKEKAVLSLVEHLCDNSAAAVDWLDGHGITLDNISQTAGSSVKRCHRPTDGSAVGATLVPGLVDVVQAIEVPVVNESDVTGIVMKDGAVAGVKLASGAVCDAKAVVLTTGGFGANFDMILEYRPDLKGYVTTNMPGTTGDGMKMAEAVGAGLVDMDQIQIHPTVHQENGALIAEAMRGGGGILVNKEGKRFIDEMKTRDVVSATELEQTDGSVFVIYDQQVFDANKDAASYQDRGLSVKAETLAALARDIGMDAPALEATVAAYNAVTKDGIADGLGRTQGLATFGSGPFYACAVAPGIHHCMGGIRIDEKCQALTKDGKPIPGLFAAGETTGGIHGANRLGGNAVCDIMVNGRTAGEWAARYVLAL